MEDLKNKRVVVMGLGRFGGGVGVTRFLISRGAKVLVTDQAAPDTLAKSVKQLEGLGVEFRLGEHLESDFASADVVVVNPAVDTRENIYLQAAIRAGVPLTSEIRLLTQNLPNPNHVIGITGSAGKSTTTAMIGLAMKEILGDSAVHVGGNIGGSLLGDLDSIRPSDWVILEISSFMLEGLEKDKWSPHIAVVTNLSPNHLDRHGTLEEYRRAKQTILDHQKPTDIAIIGPGQTQHFHAVTPNLITWAADAQPPQLDMLLPGAHNRWNAALAAEAIAQAGVATREQVFEIVSRFPGLAHRLQFVCDHAGVRYFNDSKATTPEAAAIALESFPANRVHIILGGYDKGSDFSALAKLAAKHAKAVYTIGKTGPAIARLVENWTYDETSAHGVAPASCCGGTSSWERFCAEVVRCETLDRALAETVERVRVGDVVLLSTGCASWGQFENFEQRGNVFVEAVLKYTSEGRASPQPA
jgi:UDP-N-acetylmuramoylalanine--D-glutamate ligase